ncbi:MAG: MarR family transcriptional regulator [Thermoguttaceae bacterium]|nr:MarR family transcriptional regulator [Thermoguttaceae bacterium]
MRNTSIGLISRIHAITHRWLTEELASAGLPGMVPSHGDVLALLLANGEASMHELAAFAHKTRPTMTVLVAKLERLGLVTRRKSKEDARNILVSLTDKGEALRPVFDDISRRLIAFVSSGLSPEELMTLETLLEKALSGIKQADSNTGENQ